MIQTDQLPFSTLRLLTVPARSDPGPEPLLRHAGVLIGPEGARTAWDGVELSGGAPVRFLTTTDNDLTGPELEGLANLLNGLPLPIGLSEASRARLGQLHEEATALLDQAMEAGSAPDRVGGPY
jgi:hypothetical protein